MGYRKLFLSLPSKETDTLLFIINQVKWKKLKTSTLL